MAQAASTNMRQSATDFNGDTSVSQAIAYGANIRGADSALFLVIMSSVLSEEVTGITDTLGSTWTLVAEADVTNRHFAVWKAEAAGAGANTLSITHTGASITSGSHFYICSEAEGLGTLVDGTMSTHDDTTAATTLTGPSHATSAWGLLFSGFITDTSMLNDTNEPIYEDSGLVSADPAPWAYIGPKTSGTFRIGYAFISDESLTHSLAYRLGSSEAGESFICDIQGTRAAGGASPIGQTFVGDCDV